MTNAASNVTSVNRLFDLLSIVIGLSLRIAMLHSISITISYRILSSEIVINCLFRRPSPSHFFFDCLIIVGFLSMALMISFFRISVSDRIPGI